MKITKPVAALLACLMLVAALPAGAQTDSESSRATDRIEQLRERVLNALDRRLDRIDRLQFEIKASDTIEPENAAHLTADLSASQGQLTALEAKAQSATTGEELGAIVDEMVYEHRIFALRTPQTRLVLASDFGVTVADRLESVATTVADAAARAAEAGHDVGEVESLIEDARGSAADGLGLVEPVAATVLPMEPADVPDPAREIMEGARHDLLDGREAYRHARDLLRRAAELLAEIVEVDAA